jgi:hypothetical protein
VTLRLLEELERRTGKRVYELFDMIGCTSTGGILASMAFIRRYPLRVCAQKYKEFGRRVFSVNGDHDAMRSDSSWTKFMNYVNWMSTGGVYGSEAFVEALKEVCGGERMIDLTRGLSRLLSMRWLVLILVSRLFVSDPSIPWMFFVSSSVHVNPPQPFVFRNYNLPQSSPSRYNGGTHD